MRSVFAVSAALLLWSCAGLPTAAQSVPAYGAFDQGRVVSEMGAVLDFRERSAPEVALTEDRLTTLLPELMDETGIDMWLVINREYAEDPVYFSLVPQPAFAARRTTSSM